MKQSIIVAASAAMFALALALAGCAAPQDQQSNVEQEVSEAQQETAVQQSEPIKPSPDKHTWYVKDYRGMNAASVGYTALDELRHDRYGSGTLGIVYVSAEGAYINPTDEESLKQYVVYDQNLKPNTEIKLEFLRQEDGTEYDNLVASESQEEIVLAVKKIGEVDGTAPCMTAIDSSPDDNLVSSQSVKSLDLKVAKLKS